MTSDESKPVKVEVKSEFTSPRKNAEQNEASKEPEAETPQPEELQSEKPQSEVKKPEDIKLEESGPEKCQPAKIEPEKSKPEKPQAEKSKKSSTTAKRALETSSSESDNEEEEIVGKGLLEQPLEVEGKRQRRTIQRMDNSKLNESTSKVFEIPQGTGVKLGSIARTAHFVDKYVADKLRLLHKVCFNNTCKKIEIKRHIREFCGFDFKADSEQFDKRKELLHKHHLPELKSLCEILDLDRKGGTKDEIVVNILNFLVKPTDSGRKVIKKGDKKKKKQTKTPTKKAAASPGSKSPHKSKAEVSDEESDSESNSNGSASEAEQNDKETIEPSHSMPEKPTDVKKKAVTVKAETSTPKSTIRKPNKKIVDRKATTHPARKMQMPSSSSSSSEESESEDKKVSKKQVKKAPATPESGKKLNKKKKLASDEDSDTSDIENENKTKRAKTIVESPTKETPKPPESPSKKVVLLASKVCKKATDNETKEAPKETEVLKKITQNQDEKEADTSQADSQPTDADFRKTIEKILETANLEAVTMKTVVKDVYSKYPHVKEAFLNSKKDFIKQVVREVIQNLS